MASSKHCHVTFEMRSIGDVGWGVEWTLHCVMLLCCVVRAPPPADEIMPNQFFIAKLWVESAMMFVQFPQEAFVVNLDLRIDNFNINKRKLMDLYKVCVCVCVVYHAWYWTA